MSYRSEPAVFGTVDTAFLPYLPPLWLEYLYYAQVFYSIIGPIIGISFGMVGIGMLLMGAGLCVLRMGKYSPVMLQPIALPVACGVSYIAIQMVFHRNGVGAEYVREFVPWMAGLVLVQCLALRRGFLHRAAIVILLLGLATLPFARSFANDDGRIGLEKGISIANPNDLGAWFGFCCVYFTILGIETRRYWMRSIAWVTAAGCLLVVGLTVSRGPLLAAACGIVFAFRRVLKRGFVPFFSLLLVVWGGYASGLFDEEIAKYTQRGLEDTGRIGVWPRAIARIIESPFIGVGASHLLTPRPFGGAPVTPHNAFIFIALASGMLPLLLFVAYWMRLALEATKLNAASHEDAPFATCLLMYSLLITLNLNEPFMLPWAMMTLGSLGAAGFLLRVQRAVAQPSPRGSLGNTPRAPAVARPA